MRARSTDQRGWTASRRRRIGSRFVLLLVVLSSMGGLFTSANPGGARAGDLDDAYDRQNRLQRLINRQKASLKHLEANQAALARKISGTKATLAEVNADLQRTKAQIVEMTVDVARSEQAVDELKATGDVLAAEVARVEAEAAQKEQELKEAKALLAERIRQAYDTDRTPMLTTFLSGGDFTDVLTSVGYQLDFAEQDKLLAEQIVEDQKVLDVLHQNLTTAHQQTAELEQLAADAKAILDEQLADLNEARRQLHMLEMETERLLAEQQAAYARMSRDKAEMRRKLAEARAAEAKLEKLINRLVKEQFQKGGIPSEYNGTFAWPMSGNITQEFGCTGFGMEPPLGNCPHFHRGIDIAAPMYTPVRAAGAGKVVFAGRSPYDPAWIVIIAHSEHLVSWYGHLDNRKHPPKVRAGEYVSKGQVIAYNGMTGWTTGPHLHWAVQVDDNWVNPRLFLPR